MNTRQSPAPRFHISFYKVISFIASGRISKNALLKPYLFFQIQQQAEMGENHMRKVNSLVGLHSEIPQDLNFHKQNGS